MAIKDSNEMEDKKYEPMNESNEKLQEAKPGNKSVPSTEIKNAHATGDGSFGRSESSLPEEENKKAQDNSSY